MPLKCPWVVQEAKRPSIAPDAVTVLLVHGAATGRFRYAALAECNALARNSILR